MQTSWLRTGWLSSMDSRVCLEEETKGFEGSEGSESLHGRWSKQEQLDKGGPVFLRCKLTGQDVTQGQVEPGMPLSDSVKIKELLV